MPVSTAQERARQPRTAAAHAGDEADIEFAGRGFLDASRHLNAGGPENVEAASCYQRVGVFHGRDDASDAGFDQRLCAGRRAAMVGAGLEGDIGGGAARCVARHV